MKSFLTAFLIFSTFFSFGQNRMKFKHRLSQKKIDDAGFVLQGYDSATKKYSESLKIGGTNRLRCIIKLDSKGNIFVDFWRIKPSKDGFKGQAGIVNSETYFSIDNLPKLSDGRAKIGDPTKVLCVPFNGITFGVAALPFRLRNKEDISPTEKSNKTVTSPRPDIAITGGWTVGKAVITNRSIVNYSATLGPFIGVTAAEIKNGVVKSGTELYGTTKSQTNAALSYGISLTLARNNFGLVFALGYDKSMGKYSDDWIYQKESWFGIGLSANLGIF